MPVDLEYAHVVQRLGVTVGDGADADDTPDFVAVTQGTVTFVPAVQHVKATADGGPVAVYNAPVVCTIDAGGYLTYNGKRGVWLVDLGSTKVTPAVPRDKAAYSVQYSGLRFGEQSFQQPPININPAAGSETDLTTAAPLPLPAGMTLDQVQQIASDAIAARDAAQAAAASIDSEKGVAGGIATLDSSGAVLDAAGVAQIPTSQKGAASGVASLDATGAVVDSSGTQVITTPASVAAYAQRKMILDAVTEGTPNDGVANAQPGIGSVHNMLPASGGRILLRHGSYLMNTRLIVTKPGMVLEGEGKDATTLLLQAAAFQVGVGDVLIRDMTIKGNVSAAQQLFQIVSSGAFKNWRFERCRFLNCGVTPARIGAVQDDGTVTTTGAGLDSHVEFEDCEWTGFTGDGSLWVKGTHQVTANRCWWHSVGTGTSQGDAAKFSYGAEEWRLLHSTFEDLTRDAVDCYDGQRGLVEGCTILSPPVHGVEMKVMSTTAPNPADRNRIRGNHIVDANGAGLGAPSIQCETSHCQIEGNLIEGGDVGIRLGKVVDGSANTAGNVVTGNRVIGAGNYGVALLGSDNAVVIGNSVTGSAQGYQIDGTTNTGTVGTAAMNASAGNTAADVWPA